MCDSALLPCALSLVISRQWRAMGDSALSLCALILVIIRQWRAMGDSALSPCALSLVISRQQCDVCDSALLPCAGSFTGTVTDLAIGTVTGLFVPFTAWVKESAPFPRVTTQL